MFCPLEYRDRMLVLRGMAILVLVIILGIGVTQEQLNSLTQRPECIASVAIPYDQSGIYSLTLLGAGYQMRAVYPIGQIITSERTILIKAMNGAIQVPTYIEFDCKKELRMLELWARLLVKEAFVCKAMIGVYVTLIHERINVYVSQFR